MAIKLDVQVTVVTDSFKDAVKEIIQKKVMMLDAKRSSLNMSAYGAQKHREQLEKNLRLAKRLLTAQGQDRMITALKRMKFEKFYCLKAPSKEVFLCGKTDDMLLTLRNGHKYNVGPYHICIGESAIIGDSLTQIHMFPHRKPLAEARHLHHGARRYNGNDEIKHPLMMHTNTCWGNVGSSFVSAKNEADIADMFRVLYIYVSRLNYGSPLYSGWDREVVHGYGVAV